MATLQLESSEIRLSMSRWERIASLSVDLRFPLDSVETATVLPDGLRSLRGVRAPGTHLPGLLLYGTMRHGNGRDFCIVKGHGPALQLDLAGQPFSRIVVSVPDPMALRAQLGLDGTEQSSASTSG